MKSCTKWCYGLYLSWLLTWDCRAITCFSKFFLASSSSSCWSCRLFFSSSNCRILLLKFSFWRVSSCNSSCYRNFKMYMHFTTCSEAHLNLVSYIYLFNRIFVCCEEFLSMVHPGWPKDIKSFYYNLIMIHHTRS